MAIFKNEKIESTLAVIGALASVIAVVVGSKELYDYLFGGPPRYDELIAFNDFQNESFFAFLKNNDGKVVYIDSRVDMSPAFVSHIKVLDECNNAYSAKVDKNGLLEGYVYNRRIVVPWRENLTDDGDCVAANTLVIVHEDNQAGLSFGGTGIVTFRLNGFFSIETRFFSGPERSFYMTHMPISTSDRLRVE